MATIKFFIQGKNNPTGIYVRLREGRRIDAKAKTKYLINYEDWSATKGQPKNLKDEGFKKLNQDLNDFKNKLLSHYNNSNSITPIDSTWLKEYINPKESNDEIIPNKLVDYYDYYYNNKSNLTYSSKQKLTVNKRLLERFQKTTGKAYLVSDVNLNFQLKFEQFCLEENYGKNTIARVLRCIKTKCIHAQSNGIETHFQLNSIKPRTEKVEKIYLSTVEIEKIKNAELPNEHLDNARDWLVISCETGQRISDFLNFSKNQIRYEKIEKNGKLKQIPLIEFTQKKTKKVMTVPLSKTVLSILKKRKGEFPRKISDQRFNEYIKLVCKTAGLTEKIKGGKNDKEINRKITGVFPKYELVTSHIGRRSFATNYFGIIPTSLLVNATGHSTEQMFLEYIGKTDTEKAKQLAEYFV